MRPFDFRALFERHRIEYVERGANVGRGEINIRCPFCGSADPSHHMGVNLESGHWSCWRNRRAHSGKSPVRLIVALLRIPYWDARELAGLGRDYVDPDGFSTVAQRLREHGFATTKQDEEDGTLTQTGLCFPRSFRKLNPYDYACGHCLDYLERKRGFYWNDTAIVAREYDLRMSTRGDWVGRLILPYTVDGELVAWTGRAIGNAQVRYKDLSLDQSVIPIKHTLYNHDALIDGGRALVVVEGPIDALKGDFYGKAHGVRFVALSTNSISDQQCYIIAEAAHRFKKLGFMMDRASMLSGIESMQIRDQLAFAAHGELHSLQPPGQHKDAAECTPQQLVDFAKEFAL